MRERARKTAGEQPTVFSLKSRRSFFCAPFLWSVIGSEGQNCLANRNFDRQLRAFHRRTSTARACASSLRRGPWRRRPARGASGRRAKFPACSNISRSPRRSSRRARAPSRTLARRDSCRWHSRRSAARSTAQETRFPLRTIFDQAICSHRNAQMFRGHAICKSNRGVERRRNQNGARELQRLPRRIRFWQIAQLLLHFPATLSPGAARGDEQSDGVRIMLGLRQKIRGDVTRLDFRPSRGSALPWGRRAYQSRNHWKRCASRR
jgi:hypothetical protein